jgi:NAD(P)H-dependent FMN reductase
VALKLNIIIASTRPGRVGPSVANWVHGFAREHGKFDVELVDLATFNLPVYDEPVHPRMQKYEHDHTKAWSASVASADAYVFVTPEYNYGPTPALLNALNYVYLEWHYKPCGFASYGGISGGMRAVQLTKQIVTTLKLMPIPEGVVAPMVAGQIDPAKAFTPTDIQKQGATDMLNELHRWAGALKTIR